VKIINLIQCANLGGMEQASLRLMRGLAGRGHSVRLLSLNPIGKLGPLLEEADIPHEGLSYRGKGGWRSYPLVKKSLNEIQGDGMIMTGHHLLGSLALGDCCKGNRILTIHFHHAGVKTKWQWQLIYRIACSRFNAITFPCDFIRKEAESIYPPVARLAHTVRYPLEVPPLPGTEEKAKARAVLNLPPARPIVGNAGWLIPRKRFDVFLQTAKKILARQPDTLFVIAGDGPERQKLQTLASTLGIAESIRWLGWQEEMSLFYKALDVLLFNSDWDALGLTPLEAMSYGVPVVCSVLNGGLDEIINSDDLGFLLSTHDVETLADLVLRLISKPDEATAISLAGRAHIEAVCRPEPIVEWHIQALSGKIPSTNVKLNSHRTLLPEKKLKRVTIILHRFGPYHLARLRAAGKVMDTTSIEIFKRDEVYDWDPISGADGFDRLTLFEKHPQPSHELTKAIQTALDDCHPAVVAIPGWSDAVAFSALKWCITHQVPTIVMSESTKWDEKRTGWKEWIKRRLVGICSTALAGGTPHADYLEQLGIERNKIFLGYDAVDNDYFAIKAAEVRSRKSEVRNRLGLPENFFLASARFVGKKNLSRLLEAYSRYRTLCEKPEVRSQKSEVPWDLVLLGDGPLREIINSQLSTLNLPGHVLLPGFKQYDELPMYYGLASAFVHASTTEQWGLVVNEAMASGLPVLVSNRCGCATDLVQEGRNGFTFDPYNVAQLAQLMLKISDFRFPLSTFGPESQRIIADWGSERFAAGLKAAVDCALHVGVKRASWLDRLLLSTLLSQ
jgi:1,2-diacylglycerol 3-alpha-glucosyltransferase